MELSSDEIEEDVSLDAVEWVRGFEIMSSELWYEVESDGKFDLEWK